MLVGPTAFAECKCDIVHEFISDNIGLFFVVALLYERLVWSFCNANFRATAVGLAPLASFLLMGGLHPPVSFAVARKCALRISRQLSRVAKSELLHRMCSIFSSVPFRSLGNGSLP